MIDAAPVTGPLYVLAEGPVWDASRRRILWVDIPQGLVIEGGLHGDRLVIETQHDFESYVGAVAVAEDGALLVAETRSLIRLAADRTRTTTPIDAVGPGDRLNDMLIDAAGRTLVGTLSLAQDHRSQRLLQISDGTTVLDDDLGLANGMAFSPDGSLLYSVDSVPGTVWVRPYDQATGAAGVREVLLDLSDVTPDGLTVDEHGRLWIAIWGSGEVRCYSSAGMLVETIDVPAPHVSSVAFVGDNLDRLLITTARDQFTAAQLDELPLSGSLFLAVPGCRGLPTYAWSGHLPNPHIDSENP